MSNKTKIYTIVWLCLVALFNVITFVIPQNINGFNKYEGSFWPGYIAIMVCFVIHFIFMYIELNKQKINSTITTISFISLLLMIFTGSICMIVPNLKSWIGIIICFTVLIISIIFITLASSIEKSKNNWIKNNKQ